MDKPPPSKHPYRPFAALWRRTSLLLFLIFLRRFGAGSLKFCCCLSVCLSVCLFCCCSVAGCFWLSSVSDCIMLLREVVGELVRRVSETWRKKICYTEV